MNRPFSQGQVNSIRNQENQQTPRKITNFKQEGVNMNIQKYNEKRNK